MKVLIDTHTFLWWNLNDALPILTADGDIARYAVDILW